MIHGLLNVHYVSSVEFMMMTIALVVFGHYSRVRDVNRKPVAGGL